MGFGWPLRPVPLAARPVSAYGTTRKLPRMNGWMRQKYA
jgi:hypothetical protein